MPKILTDEQVAMYHRDGFSTAVDVLSPAEVQRFRSSLEAHEARLGHPLAFPEKSKSYLLFDWADALVHHPRVLDAVEDVIGPDILVYHSTMWIKEANTPAYVLWHQDGTYFFLDPAEHVTAWVALTDATEEAGCVHFIPGSQKLGQLPHYDAPSENNMIRRGQGVRGYDDQAGVPVPVLAGQLSLHNTNTLHASGPNRANHRRMGYGISFIPTRVKPTGRSKPSALLVRGTDRVNHFLPEQRLQREGSPEAVAAHRDALALFNALQHEGFAPA
ncbi:phytanoyl-CoA dioxygenase family protein [Roseomonas sp. BN140053]|uniref:phytanoyl-CoA dioxygenase family protein n=1 Tax=Roseomonas sp. BN140053 TaxID=3391898 RepID=UPI0039EBA407